MVHNDTKSGHGGDIGPDDICVMAGRLIGLHGAAAPQVAEFFAEEHRLLGDNGRADAWRAVGSLIADILAGTPPQEGPSIH